MSSQAALFVGSIPSSYGEGLAPHIFAGYADDLARRVAALQPRAVLERACGTGIVTRNLRDRLEADCELLASDLNEPMLDVARSKFRSGERVAFQQIDAMEIGRADAIGRELEAEMPLRAMVV